ncbi:MAG: bifunctional 5,10-methylenetetrahydrofolate dehydrogenase/5,10-methenyltetrahydrofolate cyclohydrolase, partial [Planctomycetota bacterium]|nr:bifunctional 5,10-methylenetetrahydrofolate dehydrogenase/5,10-methenyltetrahydrofolate cyclohydrolase [Planctomycetota bacterium]
MPAKILDGKAIAKEMRRSIPAAIEAIKAKGIQPHLVSIQVGDDPASSVYVSNQRKSCIASGIQYTLQTFDGATTEDVLVAYVERLNDEPSVTGIIIQLPLPAGIRAARLQALIRPEKDVEGMNPANLGLLVQERPIIVPCTAMAVFEMIRYAGVDLRGKEAVMVGHSPLVGKPISILLLNSLATVTICHVATEDVAAQTRRAEILAVAAGRPGLIRGSMIRPGALVIDVGINLVEVREEGKA